MPATGHNHSATSQLAVVVAFVLASLGPAQAQPVPDRPSIAASALRLPPHAPSYLAATYQAAMRAPLPIAASPVGGDVPASLPQAGSFPDAGGMLGIFQPGGATTTANNAFFQSLGTNGRACVTCHQPRQGMSVSAASIQNRFVQTGGRDPIFAPVDGANCPSAVAGSITSASLVGRLLGKGRADFVGSHSLLLTRGLFRVFLPVPANAEYTVELVSDPSGCNADPDYDQVTKADGTVSRLLSVYRRPLMSANLKFVTVTGADTGVLPAIDPVDGSPLTPEPDHPGYFESGNIMWDGREPTLASQATDATLGHAQALDAPTTAQVSQILAFENGIYTAQSMRAGAGWLDARGGQGGPVTLAGTAPAQALSSTLSNDQPMGLYSAFDTTGSALRASIVRGQRLFNTRSFTVANVAGINNALGVPASISLTCGGCHTQVGSGSSTFAKGQLNIGTAGDAVLFGGPAPDPALPIFRLTCTGAASTPFEGRVVLTNDPGRALISGKCIDIGLKTVPQLNALAARAPYFSNGLAPTLADVVAFYDKRFSIGLSGTEQHDLANFLSAL